jgi:hypothetical protein
MNTNGMFPTFINNGGSIELWLCKIVDGLVTPVCGPEPLPAGWRVAMSATTEPSGGEG